MTKYIIIMISIAIASIIAAETAQKPTPRVYEPVVFNEIKVEEPKTAIRAKESTKIVKVSSNTTKEAVGDEITPVNVVTAVNNKRIEAGLNALTVDPLLVQAAQAKAKDLAKKKYWSHTNPEGKSFYSFIYDSGYVGSYLGENLARWVDNTDETVDAWLNSPTHKANMLKAEYTDTGVAVEGSIVVQLFGTN